jgi:hypothetical protein
MKLGKSDGVCLLVATLQKLLFARQFFLTLLNRSLQRLLIV